MKALAGALAARGQSSVGSFDTDAEEMALHATAERCYETTHNAEWTKLPNTGTKDVLILPANAPSAVIEVSGTGDMGYSPANATL